MEPLVIINYATRDVNIYNIDNDTNIDKDFISNLGYSLDDIYWMFGTNLSINFK